MAHIVALAEAKSNREYKGVLSGLKARLDQNRLGDLLVQSGLITTIQLREALALQKASGQQLGIVLLQQRLISARTLRYTLAQQISMRFLAALVTIFFSFSSLGGVKTARAGTIKDVPAQLTLVMNSYAQNNYVPINYYPALFGFSEKRSTNLGPFTKWSGMFDSFNKAMIGRDSNADIDEWRASLMPLRGLPLRAMAQKVNEIVNKRPYILDSENWGKTDYWANPVEFLSRGGDCEDFAIAKYTSLRALGVPEERLRLAIVHDKVKDIPHAVLVVYADEGAFILDNQSPRVLRADKVSRYKPIFSINRSAWWLHTSPSKTILASAE
jgi:predicted transglutaminase-like cysteine proteinase